MDDTTNPLFHIKNFEQLIRYLEDELDWPCEEYGFDEITFRYSPSDLGIKEEEATQIKSIHQLRPFFQGQPWGIFFIDFEKKRIPVVLLRRVLSHLVIKKRASANRAETAAWDKDNLLFISAFGDVDTESREIAFAHFHQEQGDLPTLRVLGWDGADTVLKTDYVAKMLQEKLHWPKNPKDVEAWRAQWTGAFVHKPGFVIKTANALAERLAELARGIRDAAQALMAHETEKGRLRILHKAFQTALIHDLSEADFADTYAQTITYGLLTAAISRTDMSAGKYGTALVAENVTDMVPVTNPFLRDMLKTFLQAGGRKGGIDFDELGIQDVVNLLRGEETDLPAVLRDFGNRAPGEDPVIHFYEHFLSAYNKKLKVQRGVFYTPKPVVSYIVHSVHELLQKEFGLEDGLASIITWGEMIKIDPEIKLPQEVSPDAPFVVVLDPATGTATFLVEVIEVVNQTLVAKWKKQGYSVVQIKDAWNEYVPKHLLPRLYGYELMMAPYAIAHMKIGLKLHETGYRFGSDERVRIYLTNSLEEPSPLAEQRAASLFEALGHEAQAVNEVKRKVPFTVVIGNPPYSGNSANSSRNYDGSWNFIGNLLQDYYRVDSQPLGEKQPKWLQDDYVKFLRFCQWRINKSKAGIVSMITNHGYLDNPTFRGMRQQLMQAFDDIYLLDLHGSSKKKETSPDGTKDENVFDIQQGVAICSMVQHPSVLKRNNHQIFQADLWGKREEKYSTLLTNSIGSVKLKKLSPVQPHYLFVPQDTEVREEYLRNMSIKEIFLENNVGFVTARDGFVIDFDLITLQHRITEFRNNENSISTKSLQDIYGLKNTTSWNLEFARKKMRANTDWNLDFTQCLYRPFDIRHIYYSKILLERPVYQIQRHMLSGKNLGLISARSNKSPHPDHFLCTRLIMETKCGESTTQSAIFPLYIYPAEKDTQIPLYNNIQSNNRSPNLSPDFIRDISRYLNLEFISKDVSDLRATFGPEDVFHYMYAVFYSPTYRSRYAEFLKIDFPRLPLTSNVELFRNLCILGKELVGLHLLESPPMDDPHWDSPVFFIGGGTSLPVASGYPKFDSKNVMINDVEGFKNVPEAVWNFHIGGYQVCQKWLKDRRGRQLSGEDIVHYKKIVYALGETIRLMGEVDAAIDFAGGWPIK